LPDFGLDQHVWLTFLGVGALDRSDIERSVRPSRLRQIFDDARNVAIALDQENVAGLERFT
jgi:hypothetical protein